ncbi:MAG: diguanylate cyclase [Desulfarculaceae bacterium]|nr:diguanylate cyclase [Desulfarculaceae bacterium]MCF8074341.1 diguanylate cyclase [Desulfarculaceae bacterium]MCF8103559.1 diguanylate cyclase [Desulfarculaceae bacterium]MCF8117326.1 diguanylate cyclase [Desulfarculaceae bacterium]
MEKDISHRIAKELNISEEDFEQRKRFLEIGEKDIALIKDFSAGLAELPPEMFDNFYEHLSRFPETREIIKDNTTIAVLKEKQMDYFRMLISGEYGWDYLMSRLAVGWRHTELGIVPLWYIGAYSKYLEGLKMVVEAHSGNPEEVFESISKVAMLDMIVTLEAYHYGKYRLQEELKKAVVTDDLTGVFNRRKFDEVMGFEMERSRRHKTPLTMIMLDIDHFKLVNDTFGHHVGDIVLHELAEIVGKMMRKGDYLIRYGGEEFVAFLPDTSLEAGVGAAERIRRKVADHGFDQAGRVTVSLGVASVEPHDTRDRFLERVDAKLYEAKEGGRNRVCW